MELQLVKDHVQNLPYMKLDRAQLIRKILKKHECKNILELGFFHGVSSMYFAAILDELGAEGKLTTIDLFSARERMPNIEQLASELGLASLVEPIYEERSYLWRLMKFIEEGRRFDFCYIDGGHTWDVTGYAFYLVNELLNDGGLILFDDLNWTPAKAGHNTSLPEEERNTAAVERVWTLLVEPHPHYKTLWRKGNVALAKKRRKLPLLPMWV